MKKAIPKVLKFMTTAPHSIGTEQTLGFASEMMRKYKIRHLPVLKDGNIQGVINDRDLKLAMSIQGVNPEQTCVSDITDSASEEVFVISPQSSMDEVVKAMAEKRIESALVVDNHHLVGIFTTTDALRAFGDLMETRLSHV